MQKPSAQEIPATAELLARAYIDAIAESEGVKMKSMFKARSPEADVVVKGSSLASLVAVDELTAASTTIIAETYKAIEVLTFIAILYGLIAMLILALQYGYERRQSWQLLRR